MEKTTDCSFKLFSQHVLLQHLICNEFLNLLQPVDQSVDQTVDQSVDQPVDQSVDQSALTSCTGRVAAAGGEKRLRGSCW